MGLMRNILGYGLALPVLSEPEPSTSRRERLKQIIQHANTHCPYYKDKYTTFLEGEKDFTDEEFCYAFSHLPIIDRYQLDANNTEFRSDELDEKDELFNNDLSPSFWTLLKHALFKKSFTTSISLSGTSSCRWLDRHDSQIYAGSVLHALSRNGWKRGQNFVAFMPESSYFTHKLVQRNNVLYHLFGLTIQPFKDITKDSVTQLLTTLKNTKATALITLPHALLRIAQIMDEENIAPYAPLQYIKVSGSFFLDCNKTFIQTMFPNSDIQCSYGATECGIVAHQSSLNSFDYDVFDKYVYLEQGPDNSILVTTYHQKAFPLIRYKIEDMGRVINYNDGTQKIKSLEGNNSDHLTGTDGYMYFPSFFNIFINELNKALNDPIIDFTLSYDDGSGNNDKTNLHLKFVLTDHTKKDKIRKTALEILKPIFANYKRITISFQPFIEHDFTTKYKVIQHNDAPPQRLSKYKEFEQIQPKPTPEQNTEETETKTVDKAGQKKAF